MRKKVVIVGCGDGGIILAHRLIKDFDVTLIDKNTMHYFQPWQLHIAFHGAKEKKIEKRKLLPRRANFVNKEVKNVDLANRKVVLSNGKMGYDYVVVDTGSRGDYSKIPGHNELFNEFGDTHSDTAGAQRLWSKVKSFSGGDAVIGISYPTYKCPPSPNEAAFMFEEYVNKHKLKPKTKITFITPFPRAYPAEPINEFVEQAMKERGINIMTFFDVESIDTKNRTISSIEGDTIHYDFAALVPPHVGAGIVKDFSDNDGFIKTDKFTLNIGNYDDAFCMGDATNIQTSKSAVTGHIQSEVISERLRGKDARFNGRTHCPFEFGYHKATFVISSYTAPALKLKPSTTNYLMKMGMKYLAWPVLKGEMNWFFGFYFNMTDPDKKAKSK
ncbi:MAG: NAD(P)/FAD-dependent oxidoreductase [Candidatus Micrarchaeia archaeon]